MGRLDDRVAIVTGASRGLGKAVAKSLAADGALVAVAARTEVVWDERLPGTIGETVAEIQDDGGRAVAIRCDLTVAEDRAHLVEEARSLLGGPITILVNNAAFTAPGRPPAPGADAALKRRPDAQPQQARPKTTVKAEWPTFASTPLRAYERHFTVGVFGAYDLMQLVASDMVDAGFGAIVNVTSGASRMPGEGPYPERSMGVLAGYGGSKAALEHLTMTAAYDLADHNIAVNALSPSKAIITPGVEYYSKVFDDVGSPEDFGEAAVVLSVVDPTAVTGRVLGHLDVIDGSFRPYEH